MQIQSTLVSVSDTVGVALAQTHYLIKSHICLSYSMFYTTTGR